eukprot:6212390-Pleurochrysis_carterae.AAC.3
MPQVRARAAAETLTEDVQDEAPRASIGDVVAHRIQAVDSAVADGDVNFSLNGEDAASDSPALRQAAIANGDTREYPKPTLSSKRLLDGSENWLPVGRIPAAAAIPNSLSWHPSLPSEHDAF